MMDKFDISFFDLKAAWSRLERVLPHWTQAGCVVFITWRLNDSLPIRALQALDEAVTDILLRNGLPPDQAWRAELAKLDVKTRQQVQWELFSARDKFLDRGFGACYLKDPRNAEVVIDSLRYFDTDRYYLTDAVVMPNHAHFLCAFADEEKMLKQCEEWKRFTGRTINQQIGRRGEFWQVDQFDHLVRGPEQFERYRRYIADNPKRARLPAGTYLHYQKDLSD